MKKDKFKYEDQKTTKEEFKNYCDKLVEDFNIYMRCHLPTCELVKSENEFEIYLHCSWCSGDLYEIFDDCQIEKMQYCPFCGAKIKKEK